jgi:biopolymer transport protein ExbD
VATSFQPDDIENGGDAIVAEINITPLTDVFLVLLIIFMVTTSVVASQGKQVDLPGAEVSDTTPQGVTVTVSPDGGLLVNDEPTTEANLFAALEQAVNILDLAQQAGATGIALATKPPTPESSAARRRIPATTPATASSSGTSRPAP